MRKLNNHRLLVERQLPLELEILFDQSVPDFMVGELRKHPSVEEGGKYIGYICEPGDPKLQIFDVNPGAHAMVITDFLPSGPKALRTSIEFMPDGEYQEGLFRQAEKLDPAIEHLGTWHSHHCNGLQTLSPGDVKGYFRTVKKPQYRPDFFLASLVKHVPINSDSSDWIDHFLFVRGADQYYLVTKNIRFIDWPTRFAVQTGHSPQHSKSVALSSVNDEHNISDVGLSKIWYETEEGQCVLGEDRRFFKEKFGGNIQTTRRGLQITISGKINDAAISVSYPERASTQDITISVLQRGGLILRIHCELGDRRIGFVAALAAVKEL